jgi:hypothetical protein
MFFSGVVSLRRLRAVFALELTELRLCFYTKNERRNFHSACEGRPVIIMVVGAAGGPATVSNMHGSRDKEKGRPKPPTISTT